MEFLSEESCQIEAKDFSGTFTFDRVFDTESQQEQVFEYSLRQTVDDLMKGYNGTVLAYGQTGSGKSYTMMGSNIDDPVYRGAIPRIVDLIFEMILQSSSDIEYTVRVSYMEIYMERIKDLLNPRNDNLPIHEDKAKGVYVKGLTEEYVSSAQEVYDVMRQGSGVRAVAATNMNSESSRSHSIFAIVVTQKNTISGAQKSGQLFLVDLAGSEKVGKTGASGQTLEEAKKINKSLSALGMVINSLTDGKSLHVPYRDSKLTRILQESLGGNSRTSLIVNCSPSSYNDAETLSTLRFGVRAKNIRNKAKINTELSPLELRQLLKKSQFQLESRVIYSNKLEGELTAWRNGEPPSKDLWVALGGPSELRSNSALLSSTPRAASAMSNSRPSTPGQYRPPSRSAHYKRGSVQESISFPMSPGLAEVEIDSIEECIRRENELQDQLSEKETLINQQERVLFELRTQLKAPKIDKEVTDLRLQVDNLNYDKKELEIKAGSLKDENEQLNKDLQDAKQKLLEISVSSTQIGESPSSASDVKAAYDLKKKRKMTEIFGPLYQTEVVSPSFNAAHTATALEEAISMLEGVKLDDPKFEDQLGAAKEKLFHALEKINSSDNRRESKSVEGILKQQDLKFRELVETINDDTKSEVEQAYEARIKASEETALQLLVEINRLQYENHEMQSSKTVSSPSLSATDSESDEAVVPISAMKEKEQRAAAAEKKIQSMQAHIEQFEAMKVSLMTDLQDRCERVVELEISLDQAREQYNLAIRDTNNKQQMKKMAMLQRNLEQLTQVQRQLVEQNVVLKKDVAMAHKIMEARNDRIQSLEHALRDSQTRLDQESEVFEKKLTYLKDRLVDDKRAAGGVTVDDDGFSPVSSVRSGSPIYGSSRNASISSNIGGSGSGGRGGGFGSIFRGNSSSPPKSGYSSISSNGNNGNNGNNNNKLRGHKKTSSMFSLASSFPTIASIGANNKVVHYPDLTPEPYVSHANKIVKPLRGGGGGMSIRLASGSTGTATTTATATGTAGEASPVAGTTTTTTTGSNLANQFKQQAASINLSPMRVAAVKGKEAIWAKVNSIVNSSMTP